MPPLQPSDRDLTAVPAFLRNRAEPTSGGVRAKARATGARPGDAGATDPRVESVATDGSRGSGPDRIDPGSLPLPGISRRRMATVAGVVAAAWLVLAFGRQVGAASAA